MTTNETVAERLRNVAYESCNANNISKAVFGESISCLPNMVCDECFTAVCYELADAIEAEQAKLKEIIDGRGDDVGTFVCWQTDIAVALGIELAERNNAADVHRKIMEALKERSNDGANDLANDLKEADVDVDALLELAAEAYSSGAYLATRAAMALVAQRGYLGGWRR